jgi:crotonobetainyl-CoA:carnitine CoA-transferase CaiB-like acyl-CoA transferase
MAMVRTPEEFMKEKQYEVLAESPLIKVEKISESEPKPFTTNAKTPLDGIRALGLAHVIAGVGFGRALALHGADVLNIWHPLDVEHEIFYNTSNVGMRSTLLDPRADPDRKTFDSLLAGADIFFANRRVGYLQRYGLSAEELCSRFPGLVHTTLSLHGDSGPGRTVPVLTKRPARSLVSTHWKEHPANRG